ncbi:MAG: glycosyl hydrolase [Acidobacteria bacterium]|nr:glycosyl hydrolase [Acidobacteriota bacterium]
MRFGILLFALTTIVFGAIEELKFRSIGPFRGGRVVTVTGVPSQPNVYYFGGTGGGVWKTTNGGRSWMPMSDGFFKTGSVGAIAVADSDPNVVYVGMGEQALRGNASHGDGVYKSVDGGKTWKHLGLAETRQIGRVRVHPRNAEVVYVCALGHMSGPNAERGVYKSVDGGANWKQVFTKGPDAGCVDLTFEPGNANVLYAGFWQVRRAPYKFESGGPGSGLFKSVDGGETWKEVGRNPGMPKGLQGKIGVTVSPVNPERVWAIVEAEDGGVFRSDDGGANWTRVNEQRMLRQRAWYYSRIYADPKKVDTVYVCNVGFHRSDDGGRTYVSLATPHGDNHDLWIAPDNSLRMVQGNDGGANVSVDGGASWTGQAHPTAQFYRVALDEDFPYGIYGAQQDNTTIKISSRGNFGLISDRDWHPVGGGESGWIAPDPKDLSIVYAGSYGGLLTRYNHKTGQTRGVHVWPDNPMGAGVESMKYRFQWNFPLMFSPHDPKVLYTGANQLFSSTDGGQSWQIMSPDLTRDDKSKQGPTGGPITKDNTSVEYYSTIFTMDESKVTKGLIWTGSDDGLVYVTRDNGKKWTNVTPKGMPEWIQINSIEASPHEEGKAYVAGTMYKSDDLRPYLYRTNDYGKTWKKIVNGIGNEAFTRVVREDPNRKGLLVAGTETGLYISYDDGENWKSFQLNLPVVPITDLAFQKREKDLVVATQGRSFWVLDELPLLYQMADGGDAADVHLYAPRDPYRYAGDGPARGGGARARMRASLAGGENPPEGLIVPYRMKEKGEVQIEILDREGKLVKKFEKVASAAGLNRFYWDLRYPDGVSFPGMIYWAANSDGPLAAPGKFSVRLTAGEKVMSREFELLKDPRMEGSSEDLRKQLELSLQIQAKVNQANEAVIRIRDVKEQVQEAVAKTPKASEAGKKLVAALTAVEEELYQTKNQSGQDPLNYPIRLNNKLAALLGTVQGSDTRPTAQASQVFEDLATKANAPLKRLEGLLATEVAAFNQVVKKADVPAVVVR